MTLGQLFWFVAGVLVTLAVLFVVYPWLSGRARSELFPSLPRWLPWVGVAAAAGVIAIYLRLGSAQLATQDATAVLAPGERAASAGASMAAAAAGAASPATKQAAGSMDSAVTGLEKRLAGGGGSDGDWELLAKSYEFLGRPDDAALARQKRLPAGAGSGAGTAASGMAAAPATGSEASVAALSAAGRQLLAAATAARGKHDFGAARLAYAKLAARNEMSADAWADYADVVAAQQGNKLAGVPGAYIQNALRMDPRHPKALWLQASLQEETKHYAAAAATWQVLSAVLGPESGDAKLVAAKLAEDQRLAGGQGAPVASGVTLKGEVVLADALRGKVPAGLTLFILAKSVNSPGAPVAILRTTTGTWPVSFQLDDSQAMLPERKLSTAGPVTIEARTSRSGQAAPAPGDFQGVLGPLDPASGKAVRIVIQRVIG